MNLLGNALKFTHEGEIVLRARPVETTATHLVVRLEVSDTGIGMEPAVLERIFEAFSQADESTTRRFGGTGLGLSICRHLVDLMDGKLGVDSQPGLGTTFWCELPFAIAASARVAGLGIEGLKIAVATPVRSLQDTCIERINAAGGTAIRCQSSFELQSLLAMPGSCDVVLLDADRLNRIGSTTRELARNTGVRWIHISRDVTPITADEAADRVAQISKPVAFRALCSAIRELQQDAAAATQSPAEPKLAGPLCNKRVLVVEDNPVNQLVVERMLQLLGCAVTIVGDGQTAVTRVATEYFDIVLMDAQIPVMDGMTATRTIRQSHARNAHVPIVGLTAHASDEARDQCLQAGMNDFLSKPFSIEQLRTVMRRCTDDSAPIDAASAG
ncbi:MAG: response regulator [Proteobacteria bacterium]|nr:response regulator [Pseudomonadota bacterium]